MTASPQPVPLLGKLLGNYRVVDQLGEGGMGVVYMGRHETLGHRVAVKVLQRELSSNADMVQRFFNEAQAAAAIRNMGIVQVFDFGTTPDGRAYFVMELLEGQSLAARLRQRRLGYVECCRIGRQIANVLQAAHARGITHRDLKPENLFLVPDAEAMGGERVKVLDFGIAKLAGDITTSGVKTRTGLIMGTPVYMSPEQCRGAGAVDARADIYALGCILFQMVCGRPPFLGEGDGEIIGAHLYLEPPRPQSLASDVPPGLAALISNMLAKSPGARPQTMAEISQALDENMQSLCAPPRAATSNPATPEASVPAAARGFASAPAHQPPAAGAARAAIPPRLEGDSTTLRDAVGASSVRTQVQRTRTIRLPFVLVGVVAAGVVGAILIASSSDGSDAPTQQGPEEARVREAAEMQPPDAGPVAVVDPPVTPDAVETESEIEIDPSPPVTPDAGSVSSSELKAECVRYQSDKKWADLEACAQRMQAAGNPDWKKYADRAVLETKALPRVAAFERALRDKRLKEAKAELDLIPKTMTGYTRLKQRYDETENTAIKELIAKLDRMSTGDCKEYERLLQQEQSTKPIRVVNEAAKTVKCNAAQEQTAKSPGQCDHAALAEKARESFAAGQYASSADAFERAWACEPDPSYIERAFVSSCNIPNAGRAKLLWKRLTASGKQRTLGVCVRNGILVEMLDAP